MHTLTNSVSETPRRRTSFPIIAIQELPFGEVLERGVGETSFKKFPPQKSAPTNSPLLIFSAVRGGCRLAVSFNSFFHF